VGTRGTLDAQLRTLGRLIAESPHNLVSRRERARVDTHLAEALAVGRELPVRAGQHWLDLGTGGGLPGLVLALAHPDVRWLLLDSVGKKVAAVQAFAAALELGNVRAVAARAETLARDPAHREAFDGVVSRAVAHLVVVAELSRGFVRPGGVVAAIKGPRQRLEREEAVAGIAQMRLSPPQARRVAAGVRETWIVTMRATGPCPPGIPRRPGVPRAQPLGGAPE
jgi:16S rRNA (guanine527-N7)-methyltransferase